MPRSEPFEAAVRAGCESSVFHECKYPSPECDQPKGCNMAKCTRAILASALPPDPAPETIEAMSRKHSPRAWEVIDRAGERPFGMHKQDLIDAQMTAMRAAYTSFRASLLPGEEPS